MQNGGSESVVLYLLPSLSVTQSADVA